MSTLKHPKTCLHCKRGFIAKNTRATFCSDKCRMANTRRKAFLVTEKLREGQEKQLLEKKLSFLQNELSELENELGALIEKEELQIIKMKAKRNEDLEELKKLKIKREYLQKENGKYIKEGSFVRLSELGESNVSKMLLLAAGGLLDKQLGTGALKIDHSKQIEELNKKISWLELTTLFDVPEYIWEKDDSKYGNGIKLRIEGKKKEIMELKRKIDEPIKSKSLNELKDQTGFISAKSLKYASFSERIRLEGAMGDFLGDLELDKLAITLLGKPGSGKTYFTFDLMRAFSKLDFTIAYFSLEEGINDLTRIKLEKYDLMEKDNIMLIDKGNIEDIKKAAPQFKVIIIDSWGKLNAPTDEFDVLRNQFPQTIFISIFQQTSSGQMRGGTKAAFDAGINIETFKEGEERIAVCTKNRYGITGLRYGINEGKLLN